MEWVMKEPVLGDIVRVNMGIYYHYGIFESDDSVIQFGLPNNVRFEPATIKVLTSDIETFLSTDASSMRLLEVAEYTKEEMKSKRKPSEIISYARSKLGTGGFDILHNNCEHFVNECVFAQSRSSFIDQVREKIKKRLNS